jgi:hypothetical protein
MAETSMPDAPRKHLGMLLPWFIAASSHAAVPTVT